MNLKLSCLSDQCGQFGEFRPEMAWNLVSYIVSLLHVPSFLRKSRKCFPVYLILDIFSEVETLLPMKSGKIMDWMDFCHSLSVRTHSSTKDQPFVLFLYHVYFPWPWDVGLSSLQFLCCKVSKLYNSHVYFLFFEQRYISPKLELKNKWMN